MSLVAVFGVQWGDEGKGKLVDVLTQNSKACARYNGGANAGHTIVYGDQKVGLRLLPCGIMHKGCKNVIGNGVVVSLSVLAEELDAVAALVGESIDDRVVLSSRAHLTCQMHLLADGLTEARTEGTKDNIGTTRRGVGPSYAAKALRISLRACDLLKSWTEFEALYWKEVEFFKQAYGLTDLRPLYLELEHLKQLRVRFAPLVQDIVVTMDEILAQPLRPVVPSGTVELDMGRTLLSRPWHVVVEGANATMLDIDVGTYPFCTSSTVLPSGMGAGLSLDPRRLTHVVGVVKAYTTRVGSGPFPTELTDDVGDFLQQQGKEFGVVTGRRRRCGWLDLALVKYSCFISAPDSIMLTKLDVLSQLTDIKIAINYIRPDGSKCHPKYFPADLDELASLSCEYLTLPGWKQDITHLPSYQDLPPNAKAYVETIERILQIPVLFIGIGPGSDDILTRSSSL
ncbi:adenylosuccinate synthetase [Gregarina niphandrodes]|uniref:Adenylosuccinate synthetase n=1 Tax=Gregarina niphandrodes TaxID=110365 RepID=A0A023B4X5_GRENI|nr:adenylosuccinate synthetase [Gregarina niphandrodes]EZG57840.1 adenylosuccinate synthetase [Gregarina niphandrodes]|eukprot:XP_011131027.1 adenylosuccinate synthetase [Gregarina niphandrodes]